MSKFEDYEEVIEKEFQELSSGERLGWYQIGAEDESKFTRLKIVTAIADGGAAKLIRYKNEEDRTLYASDGAQGFHGTNVLELILERDSDNVKLIDIFGPKIEDRMGHSRDRAIAFLALDTHGFDAQVERKWFVGKTSLLESVRLDLIQTDREELYPYFYYNLNGHSAQSIKDKSSDTSSSEYEEFLFPDPKMQEQTAQIFLDAKDSEVRLEMAYLADRKMVRNLSVFGDAKPEDIPRLFEKYRINQAIFEQDLIQKSITPFGRYYFLPVGVVRSWPYMDASEPDNDKAFGLELRDLKNREVDLTLSQIKYEMKELEKRRLHAQAGLLIIKALQELEKQEA